MPILLILVACVLLLVCVRPGGDRFIGIFRYQGGMRSPNDDGLATPRGVQEEDAVTPWQLDSVPRARTDAAESAPDRTDRR